MSSPNRQPARRTVLRAGLPTYLSIPRFTTTDELEEIRSLKEARPALSWEECVRQVLLRSKKKAPPPEGGGAEGP